MNTERIELANGAADQAIAPGIEPLNVTLAALAQRRAAKAARRKHEPLFEGSLFDLTARNQLEMF